MKGIDLNNSSSQRFIFSNLTILLFLFLLCRPFLLIAQPLDDPNFLRNFENYAEKARTDWNVPGMAIAIVKGDQVIYMKGFGVKSLSNPNKVNTHTLFQIGSISKQFTSALTSVFVDQKLIHWQDPVIQHLPNFTLKDPWVTREFQIIDLYSQYSGLPAHIGDIRALLGFKASDIIENLKLVDPASSFRSTFAYQNIFFNIGADILHKHTGKDWGELLNKYIFQPLEMSDTSTTVQAYLDTPNKAEGHYRNKKGEAKPLPNHPEHILDWVYTLGPAGGINSTIQDMSKWLTLLINEGKYKGQSILAKDQLNTLFRPRIFMGDFMGTDNYYCLGITLRRYSPYNIIWHNGATSGVDNAIALIPEEKIGIVVLNNLRGALLSEALAMQFFDMYFGKPNQDWSQMALKKQQEVDLQSDKNVQPEKFWPAMPLESYTGMFENPIFGNAQVFIYKEKLAIKLGPTKSIFPLTHLNRDTFMLDWPSMNEDSLVHFRIDENGSPSTVYIELFKEEGDQGIFKKVLKEKK